MHIEPTGSLIPYFICHYHDFRAIAMIASSWIRTFGVILPRVWLSFNLLKGSALRRLLTALYSVYCIVDTIAEPPGSLSGNAEKHNTCHFSQDPRKDFLSMQQRLPEYKILCTDEARLPH